MNRIVLATCSAFIALAVAIGNVGEGTDTLLHVDDQEAKQYREVLDKMLLLTSADCGRMLVKPSWDPEYAVSVYSQSPPAFVGMSKYMVTLTQASTSIWDTLQTKPLAISNVKIERYDAALGMDTALAVKQLWNEMLSREWTVPLPSDYYDHVDGEIVEFRAADGAMEKLGELPIEPGPHVEALATVGQMLARYARAPDNERTELEYKIHQQATELYRAVKASAPLQQ